MAKSLASPPPPAPPPPPSPPSPSSSPRRRKPSLKELTPKDHGQLLSFTVHDFRKKFMHMRDESVHKKLQEDVSSLHKQGILPYGDPRNVMISLPFLSRRPTTASPGVSIGFSGLGWRASSTIMRASTSKSCRVCSCRFPSLSSPHGGDEYGHLHDLALHDSYGHFTVFGPGNKANVAGEKFSSDAYIHNELMRYLGDELK